MNVQVLSLSMPLSMFMYVYELDHHWHVKVMMHSRSAGNGNTLGSASLPGLINMSTHLVHLPVKCLYVRPAAIAKHNLLIPGPYLRGGGANSRPPRV